MCIFDRSPVVDHQGESQPVPVAGRSLSAALVFAADVQVSDDFYIFYVSGKTTPVSLTGPADPSKPCDPFQSFTSDVIDPFQSKKGPGDPFSGKDPFAPSTASSKTRNDSSLALTDVSSAS